MPSAASADGADPFFDNDESNKTITSLARVAASGLFATRLCSAAHAASSAARSAVSWRARKTRPPHGSANNFRLKNTTIKQGGGDPRDQSKVSVFFFFFSHGIFSS
jgi:hypothetical protein